MIKRFTLILSVILALCASTAQAANVISEEEWAAMLTVSPNPSTIQENLPAKMYLQPKSGYEFILISGAGEPTLTLPDKSEVDGMFDKDDPIAELTGRIAIVFASSFTESGEYILTLPEGRVKVTDKYGEEIGVNPVYDVVFTVKEPKVIENPLVNPVFIPASGSTVANICNNLSITFPSAEIGWTLACFSSVCLELVCVEGEAEGDSWVINDWHWYENEDGSYDRTRCVFEFKRMIATPGKYELRIKSYAFKTFVEGVELYNVTPFVGEFTIGAIGNDEITLDSYRAVDPSNDTPVSSLRVLHIEFPNCAAPEFGLEEGDKMLPPEGPGICSLPALISPEESIYTNVSISQNATNNVRFAESWKIMADRKTIEVVFNNPFTEDGLYTLTIPQGMLRIKNTSPAVYNSAALPLTYELKYDPNAIDTPACATVVVAPVYDLNGNKVLELATEADLKNLPAGIYIFNSRKFVVK